MLVGRRPALAVTPPAPPSHPACIPPHTVLYAIGDIHGRADLLHQLLDLIIGDVGRSATATVHLVFLGDYVDRGPDSSKVVETLLLMKRNAPEQVTLLKGNHEQALLEFLEKPSTGGAWADHGGRETLLSYGVIAPMKRSDTEGWLKTRDAFVRAVPAPHLNLLQSLAITKEVGDYLFVHAGVRPGVALEDQKERDLLWIREDFLDVHHGLGKMVVHGHTLVEKPEVTPARIGIDTGAYASGILTALKLSATDRSFLQTGASRTQH